MAVAAATKDDLAGDNVFERKAAELGEMIAAARREADETAAIGTPEARERARLIRWHATRDENWIVSFRKYIEEHPDD